MCGDRIKHFRLELGLTQEQIEEKTGMDFSQWGKIERGQTNITLSTLIFIAEALEVKPADLITFN